MGIGQLPWFIADELVDQGLLVPVLQPWHPPSVEVFAVYPSGRYLTPKVRAFVKLALAKFPRPRTEHAQPTPHGRSDPS